MLRRSSCLWHGWPLVWVMGIARTVLAGSQPEPRGVEMSPERARAVLAPMESGCRETIAAEFVAGRATGTACDRARAEVTERILRGDRRRTGFGVVERIGIDLSRVHLVLSSARRCKRWPLRSVGQPVLRVADALRAGCRVRRYEGSVPLFGVLADGRRVEVAGSATDADGRVEIEFVELERRLHARGRIGLDGLVRLDLGTGGWAGSVDLGRLRQFVAAWHFVWVLAGRGSPGLWVQRHRDEAGAAEARALAVEAQLDRHQRDYRSVARGELSPQQFLDRYPVSPFRASVEAMAGGRPLRDAEAGPQLTDPVKPP